MGLAINPEHRLELFECSTTLFESDGTFSKSFVVFHRTSIGCWQDKLKLNEYIVGVAVSFVRRIHSETARDAHYADRRKRGLCPNCGHRVPLPCVVCAAEKDPLARSDHRQDSKIILGVDLLPEDYARYLEIRQNKIAEGDLSIFLGELLSQI